MDDDSAGFYADLKPFERFDDFVAFGAFGAHGLRSTFEAGSALVEPRHR